MSKIIKKVQHFIFQKNLFQKGDKIVAAVSGGPDSIFLLHLLLNLASKYDWDLRLVHINYQLRDKESDEDECLVKEIAKNYHLSINVKKIKWKKGRIQKINENELRKIRYEYLEKIRKRYNYDKIAVGHHKNDQAETVLLHLLRGSGLQGLSGIQAKNNFIARPLLILEKKEIVNYLKKNKIQYRQDSSNQDTTFWRNKIRWRLIPYLRKNFNPQIIDNLALLAENVAEDYNFIEKETEKKFLLWKIDFKKDRLVFSRKKFLRLSPALQKMFLRLSYKKIKGNLADFESGHLREILKIIKSTKSKRHIFQHKNLKLERKDDKVILMKLK